MNKRARIGHLLCTGLFATALGCGVAAPAFAASAEVIAQAPTAITDTAGVLSTAEEQELTEKITQLQQEQQLMVHIVFSNGFDGMRAEDYASALVNEKGPNSAAYVVDVEGRTMGVQSGDQWPQGKLDEMYDAAYGPLATDDWEGSANALMDAALGTGGGDGNGGAWLAGAGGAAVVAGGGSWA